MAVSNRFNKPLVTASFYERYPVFRGDRTKREMGFLECWMTSPFYVEGLISTEDLEYLYYNLLARYGEDRFKYQTEYATNLNVFRLIRSFYPNTVERMKLANEIREMDLQVFKRSGTTITSQGQNPKLKMEMDKMIEYLDNQTASFQLKSEEQATLAKLFSLKDGYMELFLERCREWFSIMAMMYNNIRYNYKDVPDWKE